jgi:hypothetical protein
MVVMDSPQWRVLNLLAHMLHHSQWVLVDDCELADVRDRIDELAEAIADYIRAVDDDDELPF